MPKFSPRPSFECADIDDLLDGSPNGATIDRNADARLHLAECRRCDLLVQALSTGHASIPAAPSVEDIRTMLLRDLRPVRPLWPASVFLAILSTAFALLVSLGVYRLGPHGWLLLTALQKVAVSCSLFISAFLLGSGLIAQMTPGGKQWATPSTFLAAAFALLTATFTLVFHREPDPSFLQASLRCLTVGLLFSVPAAALVAYTVHRGVFFRPLTASILAGAFSGLVGTGILEGHCPLLDLPHILVSHVGVAVLTAFAGLLLGYWRSTSSWARLS